MPRAIERTPRDERLLDVLVEVGALTKAKADAAKTALIRTRPPKR